MRSLDGFVAAALSLAVAAAAHGQGDAVSAERFAELLDVHVVNIEVFVTDRDDGHLGLDRLEEARLGGVLGAVVANLENLASTTRRTGRTVGKRVAGSSGARRLDGDRPGGPRGWMLRRGSPGCVSHGARAPSSHDAVIAESRPRTLHWPRYAGVPHHPQG